MLFLIRWIIIIIFGFCNVNFCEVESTGECLKCKNAFFVTSIVIISKFISVIVCKWTVVRVKIDFKAASSLLDDEFRSKFSPCSSLSCFQNSFMFYEWQYASCTSLSSFKLVFIFNFLGSDI